MRVPKSVGGVPARRGFPTAPGAFGSGTAPGAGRTDGAAVTGANGTACADLIVHFGIKRGPQDGYDPDPLNADWNPAKSARSTSWSPSKSKNAAQYPIGDGVPGPLDEMQLGNRT